MLRTIPALLLAGLLVTMSLTGCIGDNDMTQTSDGVDSIEEMKYRTSRLSLISNLNWVAKTKKLYSSTSYVLSSPNCENGD